MGLRGKRGFPEWGRGGRDQQITCSVSARGSGAAVMLVGRVLRRCGQASGRWLAPARRSSTGAQAVEDHERWVVKSPMPQVAIPNVTITQAVWENLDRWPDKTALVSFGMVQVAN